MSNTQITRPLFDQLMVPNYAPLSMIPVRGEGSRVWDQEDNEYLDLTGGIAVNALGHAHPELVDALTVQAQKLWHVSNIYTNEPALQLAQKLVDNTFAEKVFFANSGAEANEAALKLARRYAQDNFSADKTEIIAFYQGFHGRTFFTVTAGGQSTYSDGFGPKPGDITHLEYNDLTALEAAISDKTCAVILEPLQGEGGVLPICNQFAIAVRALCNKHNALMILDEVQTGMGRTGHLFAYMGLDVVPDVVTSAKALGAGFPISAMLTTTKLASCLTVGTHGTTFGGNPLACAVASKAFDLINTPEMLNGVKQKEQLLRSLLTDINQQFNVFEEIRGAGLLLGAVLNEQYQGRAKDFFLASAEQGLLVLVAGANVIRFAPALNISEDEIKLAMIKFGTAVKKVVSA
ncbi:aspartate aminotransferase family protein [Psychromonas sp. psych-6C06]|uniref:aspartate aminotransferase family protein n=1 Tax=Psychromonas sp. psych-6C06 TaxID=2058089 RepID=UPI000C332AF5|nr:aspartate aminotransferase family protein [Psychromonas sp. psych-6C06]PKF60754.1 aspartate aminotransferase family protein [Psychromonas sp. psych-6C06]